jgi:periplasmic protein TonB
MAYADQEVSGNRIAAFVVVALLHLALGYALVTGLAYEGFKQVLKRVTTVDIKKDEPKKEPPPPPKKMAAPPPIVAPPPRINVNNVAPPVQTVTVAPPPAPVVPVIVPAPPSAPPAPPPPKVQVKQGTPKGNPGGWVTNNDYPTRALRENRSGTTGFRLSYGPDGRPTGCDITNSSGSPDLDSTACSLLMRRAKFVPGVDGEGHPTGGSFSSRFRWVIPEE